MPIDDGGLRRNVVRDDRVFARLDARSPRVAEWLLVLGTTIIELESRYPVKARKPDGTEAIFYKARVSALNTDQRDSVIQHLARTFKLPPDEVSRGLDDPEQGLPILAQDIWI